MKRILLLSLLFFGFAINAQIKKVEPTSKTLIGQIAPMGNLHIKIEKSPENTYLFTYNDVKFQTIDTYKSFEFKDIDGDFDNLYNMIIDGLNNTPKEPIMLELPDSFIWLNFNKSLGVANVQIGHSVGKTDIIGYSVWMTKKKVNQLFGKSK